MDYTYSFIIPHHNTPELLNRCLDSIPKRNDVQVIVVDDNSQEDKRPNISRSDVEIIYIDAIHTKGAGHARNVGLSIAKGKWVLFPDSDDYYTNKFIDILDLYRDRDIDVLYFNYHHIDSNGAKIADILLQRHIAMYEGKEEQTEYIKFRNNTPWTKMISLSYIRAHRMYFEEVTNGNDVLFSLFVASYTDKVCIISNKLYCYVKNSDSIGTKKQTLEGLKCRITHYVQHSAFNRSISHPEWNSSICHYFSLIYKRNGLLTLIKLLPFIFELSLFNNSKKHEWEIIIRNHK